MHHYFSIFIIFTTSVLHYCAQVSGSYIILFPSFSQLVDIAHLIITRLWKEWICWHDHASQALLRRTMGDALDAPQHPSGLPSAKWHDSHVGVPPGGHTDYSKAWAFQRGQEVPSLPSAAGGELLHLCQCHPGGRAGGVLRWDQEVVRSQALSALSQSHWASGQQRRENSQQRDRYGSYYAVAKQPTVHYGNVL